MTLAMCVRLQQDNSAVLGCRCYHCHHCFIIIIIIYIVTIIIFVMIIIIVIIIIIMIIKISATNTFPGRTLGPVLRPPDKRCKSHYNKFGLT